MVFFNYFLNFTVSFEQLLQKVFFESKSPHPLFFFKYVTQVKLNFFLRLLIKIQSILFLVLILISLCQDPMKLYIIVNCLLFCLRLQVKMLGESLVFSLQSTLISNSTSYCILVSSFHLFNLLKRCSLSGFWIQKQILARFYQKLLFSVAF